MACDECEQGSQWYLSVGSCRAEVLGHPQKHAAQIEKPAGTGGEIYSGNLFCFHAFFY